MPYRKGNEEEQLMRDHNIQPSRLTRRRVLGGMGVASLALMSSASAQETVDLHVPGGPSTRLITTSYPQKGPMILQRSSPPWLETPFEVFDKGVFTPNDQHYVSWHWANFPGDIDVDSFRLTVRGQVNQTLSDRSPGSLHPGNPIAADEASAGTGDDPSAVHAAHRTTASASP